MGSTQNSVTVQLRAMIQIRVRVHVLISVMNRANNSKAQKILGRDGVTMRLRK